MPYARHAAPRAVLAIALALGCARTRAPAPAPSSAAPAAVSAAPAAPAAAAVTSLGGTGWRLVRVRGADGAERAPDEPGRYTVGFAADGAVYARLDCNRGRGTWTSPAPGRLGFGPLALTRAMCPPGSLGPQIAGDWARLTSYTLRDGRLTLTLAGEGGAYEWEPDSTALPTRP